MMMQDDYSMHGSYGGYGTAGYSAGGHGRYCARVLPKETWAGASIDRAFSEDTPWTFKRQGQIKFYQAIQNLRRVLRKNDLGLAFPEKAEGAQPQLSAFYTSFPWPARAALGHTIYMETECLVHEIYKAIIAQIVDRNEAGRHGKLLPAYTLVCHHVALALAHRAILADLTKSPELRCVEIYRLFQISQSSLCFRNLHDVIRHAVLFGDVLPEQSEMRLHPMTTHMLSCLSGISMDYAELEGASDGKAALSSYASWGKKIMAALLPLLPNEPPPNPPEPSAKKRPDQPTVNSRGHQRYEYSPQQENVESSSDYVPPLGRPMAPALTQPASFSDMLRSFLNSRASDSQVPEDVANLEAGIDEEKKRDEDTKKAFEDMTQTAFMASGQDAQWEDMREDLVGQDIEQKPFEKGPVEGQPTSGMNITREIGGEEVGGDLFDRPVALSENEAEVQKLRNDAFPIAEMLRRNLYPSLIDQFILEFPRASGQMDPRRLPIAEFSDSVYRQTRVSTQRDPAGKALLLIAADGSSSLTDSQMRMCKLLVAAWLESVKNRQIEIIAALYNSDTSGKRGRMALVQWVYHPRKTAAFSHSEAVRAVAALPDSGKGCQSDALSLTYLLDEAHALARGSQTYLILITDCAWNKSFPAAKSSPSEEMQEVLDSARRQFKQRLHITLVALEDKVLEEIRTTVDSVMVIQPKDLENAAEAAKVIGAYVANCISERRNMARNEERKLP